jgi:cell division protein FtsI (penicillin-binding protein 3)
MYAAQSPDDASPRTDSSERSEAESSTARTAPPTAAATLQVEDPTVLPDFRGVPTRQAVHWLDARGIQITLQGRGTVVQQSVAPGAALPNDLTLTSE